MTLKRRERRKRRKRRREMRRETRKEMRPPPESSLNFPTMTRRVAMKSLATWQSSSRSL
jgi:hypothetical protein